MLLWLTILGFRVKGVGLLDSGQDCDGDGAQGHRHGHLDSVPPPALKTLKLHFGSRG